MMPIERKKTLNVFKDAREAWGSYDDFPVGQPGTDPMPHLSRNRVAQPFYLVSEADQVLIQMAGRGEIRFRDSDVELLVLEPGDTVYVPACVPSQLVPYGENVQIRLKAEPGVREAVAWYCACGALVASIQIVPGEIVPGDLVPGDLAPGELVPGKLVPGDLVPGDLVPGEIVPGDLAPGDLVPGEIVPGEIVPGEIVPGELVPGELVPGDLAPGDLVPGKAAPGVVQDAYLAAVNAFNAGPRACPRCAAIHPPAELGDIAWAETAAAIRASTGARGG